MSDDSELRRRAARHAALGDSTRLAIVDELARSDRTPGELAALLDLPTNLLAHHTGVLESAGLVHSTPSEGDRRRRYLSLVRPAACALGIGSAIPSGPVLFVCTHNSARSQMAAALWTERTGEPAESAGTHPSDEVHPGAVAAANRAGLSLESARPRHIGDVAELPRTTITVCDRAHEEIRPSLDWWHWSIPDPVPIGSPEAFDDALATLTDRLADLDPGGSTR